MQYAPYTTFYNEMEINGKLIKLPWKALEMGKPDKVYLNIKRSNPNNPYTNLKVGVMGGADLLPFAGGDTPKRTYNLVGATEGEEAIVATFQDSSRTMYAGGIWTATYQSKPFKVYLVPLPGIDITEADRQSLQGDMNTKIFSQAVVSWTVGLLPGITGVNLGDNGLDWADKDMLSSYNSEMNGVISTFKDWKKDVEADAYYLFVVPKFSEGGVEGFMPRNRRFGFITQEQVAMRTVAHELGHGAFNLTHTFPGIPQGSTDNLMDYSDGLALYKPQWDLIHNPEFTTGLWDGMEDGAQISGTLMFADVIAIINKIREANKEKKDELAIQLTTGTGKEDEHFELGGKDYTYLQMITTGFNPLTDTQPTVTVPSAAGSATINTERPSYKIKPSELSKTTYTENSIKYVKYVFHELQTLQNGVPYADTKVATGTNRIEIIIKLSDAISFEFYLFPPPKDPISDLITVDLWKKQGTSNCAETCKSILRSAGITAPASQAIYVGTENQVHDNLIINGVESIKGINAINYSLETLKQPIIVGVNHTYDYKIELSDGSIGYPNSDETTDHFIIIVGRDFDILTQRITYHFFDVNATNNDQGTKSDNKLFLNTDNSLTGSSAKTDKTYTVTQVRPN